MKKATTKRGIAKKTSKTTSSKSKTVIKKKATPKTSAAKKSVSSITKATKAKRVTAKKTAVKKPAAPRLKKPPAVIDLNFEEIVAQVAEGQPEESIIEGSKFDIGVQHNAHALPLQEVPNEYGKNQVMLLVVDPRFVFTYWEIRQDTMNEAMSRLGGEARLTLRFYDVTITHNPDTSHYWDVEVFDRLGNWYLKLTNPEQKLCLDVGLKGRSGEFHRLARSNFMHLPRESLAKPGPIKWMVVTPSGDKLISDMEEYTDADLALLKMILGPYFFDLLMRGRFASIAGSSLEAIFFDVQTLGVGESPSGKTPWAT